MNQTNTMWINEENVGWKLKECTSWIRTYLKMRGKNEFDRNMKSDTDIWSAKIEKGGKEKNVNT